MGQSVLYAYIVLLPLLLLCVVITYCCCFSFCYVDTVCGFTTEYLDLLLIYCNYTVRCCTMYDCIFCCCCSVVVCCYTAAMLLLLLLFIIVCRMTKFVVVVHCIWFQCFFLLIQTRFIFNVPLGSTVAFTASIFYLKYTHSIHPRYYGHAWSQGGR